MELPAGLASTLDAGGPIMWPMLVASVLVVALAIERGLAIRRARQQVRRLDEKVVESARRGELEEARRLCEGITSPWREVFACGLDRALGRVRGDAATAMQRELKRAIAQLRFLVWTLGTAGAMMPFVGLLGTVLGVLGAFRQIGVSGSGGFAVVSAGISEALIATAAGLFVALEAVLAFNWIQNAIADVARELSLLVDETAELIQTRRGEHAGSASGK